MLLSAARKAFVLSLPVAGVTLFAINQSNPDTFTGLKSSTLKAAPAKLFAGLDFQSQKVATCDAVDPEKFGTKGEGECSGQGVKLEGRIMTIVTF